MDTRAREDAQRWLADYHDIYGDLDPAAALAILTDLPLPAETPHFAELRSVLAAGHSNHYRSTHAWNGARQTHP